VMFVTGVAKTDVDNKDNTNNFFIWLILV